MRSSLFLDVKQRRLVVTDVSGQPVCPIFKDQGTAWALKMGPLGYPETSVNSYQYTLLNISEEQRFHVHRGGILKSHNLICFRNCVVAVIRSEFDVFLCLNVFV